MSTWHALLPEKKYIESPRIFQAVGRGIGSVKRLEFHTFLVREDGTIYIWMIITGIGKEAGENKWVLFQHIIYRVLKDKPLEVIKVIWKCVVEQLLYWVC